MLKLKDYKIEVEIVSRDINDKVIIQTLINDIVTAEYVLQEVNYTNTMIKDKYKRSFILLVKAAIAVHNARIEVPEQLTGLMQVLVKEIHNKEVSNGNNNL